MDNYIITIDTGTTNTRIILWDANRNQLAIASSATGVRNTAIDGNNIRLKKAVKSCIESVMEEKDLAYDQIKRIIASGMITSNVGLVEIPHVTAPASADDLAKATKSVLLEDIAPIPIWFIPGIKNFSENVNLDNYESMDIMRGEEVESIAIIDEFFDGNPMLLVLPGSHSKFIPVNQNGEITGCLTTISGELLASITNDTIIADAVGRKFVSEETYDKEMLIEGYKNGNKTGVGRACFSARILNQFAIDDKEKVANYILGVVLSSDIQAIKESSVLSVTSDYKIVVSGKNPLRKALCDIMEYSGEFNSIQEFVSEKDTSLSALGAYIIAEKSNIL